MEPAAVNVLTFEDLTVMLSTEERCCRNVLVVEGSISEWVICGFKSRPGSTAAVVLMKNQKPKTKITFCVRGVFLYQEEIKLHLLRV